MTMQSLAGVWKFRLDAERIGLGAEWFKTELPDKTQLPGSCEEHGHGTPPVASNVNCLTRVLQYEGPAWYQREIDVPESWGRKRVELFLERCHWETTVWVDERRIGSQNSLCVPHVYSLGELTPGRHRLTICVDNTFKLPIGAWASAITEQTQTNWNGIVGRIELRATDPVWIRAVHVHAEQLKIDVGNETPHAVAAMVQGRPFDIPAGGITLALPFVSEAKPWDEFDPQLASLTVSLRTPAWQDETTVVYAKRELTSRKGQFVLNGRPLLLRGPVDECVYPLTGYAPMDKMSWLRVLRICQSYGFNFVRFHSWCPPRAAFEAADELGFLFQVELPLWTMFVPPFGEHPERERFVQDELDRILDTYGNHPSFGLMAMGNESGGTLDRLVTYGREKDRRRLYRCENGGTPDKGDYTEEGQRGFVGPRTNWDRWSVASGWIAGGEAAASHATANPSHRLPLLAHEVGQWLMYPDYDQIKKYTGVLRADMLELSRRSLEAHQMLDQAKAFAEASGRFSVLLYKEEIEASMRTFPYGGFQILEARDFPGQGTAYVGWLDAFWDSKGLISPEEFRRFCAPTVCLIRMPKRILTTGETFVANAEIAHYGPHNLKVCPTWMLTNEKHTVLASGRFSEMAIETGRVTPVGEIQIPLAEMAAPSRLILSLSAGGTFNQWNIWVYPTSQTEETGDVLISQAFDQATRAALAAGRRVLLYSSPKEGVVPVQVPGWMPNDAMRLYPPAQPGSNAIPGSFMPAFWSMRLFNQPGTLGILCDPSHPALAQFPTEQHGDWQWADLLGRQTAAYSFLVAHAPYECYQDIEKRMGGDITERSKAIMLDDTPPAFRPIVQVIDNYDRNMKLGVIFEARVGPGRLLICAMDLNTDLASRPAARQLRTSLLDYAKSDRFQPVHELSEELLNRLLL